MDISALKNNPFAMRLKGVQGANPTSQVTAPKAAGADGGNPFSPADNGYVGLGIKDGEQQTSAAQLGKKPMLMRQIGIA